MNQYPKIANLLEQLTSLSDKKAILFETRRSIRSILSQLLLFFIAVAVVILLNLFLPTANLMALFHVDIHISLRWLGILPALFFLEGIRRYHDDLYAFSAQNITHYDGRLSLNYNVPNVRYVDIRAVVVHQDIFGRILDYGDIEIDTSAQEKTEMYLSGVRSPQELAALIEALRTAFLKSIPKDHPQFKNLGED